MKTGERTVTKSGTTYGIGAAGALAITALVLAAPMGASAANLPRNESLHEVTTRLEGPFETKTAYNYGNRTSWTPGNYDQVWLGTSAWTFPAPGTTGPIFSKQAGKCLTLGTEYLAPVLLQPCTGSAAQTFSVDATGFMKGVGGATDGWSYSDAPNTENEVGFGPLVTIPPTRQAQMEVLWFDHLSEIQVTSVDITGPANGSTTLERRPPITGTGEDGATIEVKDANGNVIGTTVVQNGKWSITSSTDLPLGPNTVTATQTSNGLVSTDTTSFTVSEQFNHLVANVVSIDNDAKTAVVGGTGQKGATIVIDGPNGPIQITVGDGGTWTVQVPGLPEGGTSIDVTQKAAGHPDETQTLTISIVAAPIADTRFAAAAGGFVLLGLPLTTLTRLRRRADS